MNKIQSHLDEIKRVIDAATQMWGFHNDKILYHRAQNPADVQKSIEEFAIAARTTMPQLVEALRVAVETLELCNRSSLNYDTVRSVPGKALTHLEQILCPAPEGEEG